ncbi:DinB family protein [Brevibacillus sp. GCM10020057]|uniref:DinB family protein n=1 Tax=Brevibacillus sp. GCM10020057 TaxID=3317327 RepID=UPI003644E0A8
MAHDSLRLYDYHVWANEKVFQRLREVPPQTCEQEIQSVFPSILQTLKHMLQTEHVWLLAMKGESFDQIRQTVGKLSQQLEGKGLDALHAGFAEAAEAYREFLSTIDLDATTSYSHPAMGTLTAPYRDILTHVVNHGTYHRGNISAMLRQLGHAGASHDFIYYLFAEQSR